MQELIRTKNIRHFSLKELTEHFESIGEKSFHAKQVYEWLWKKGAHSFEEMTNLSKSLRQHLIENFTTDAITIDTIQKSSDKTIKVRFKLFDGHFIEGVLIPTTDRLTACISSQVGCSLTCKFCATGYMDRKRNLNFDEIFDQVILLTKQAEENFSKPLSNIVFMGMGEPLLNYNNVIKAIGYITSPNFLGISSKRITVSTAGIAKMIKKLGDDGVKFNLALSLHASDDKKRNQIMPINEQNELKAVTEALSYFYEKTKNKITFEYIMFHQFNDSMQDAENLINICKRVPAKVNIIEYNPIEHSRFTKAKDEQIDLFAQKLRANKIPVSIRRSRGKDIDAACGQLANK